MNQFKDQTIQCNNNEDCTIICDQLWSCQRAQIICPTNKKCNIECTGYQGCAEASFQCGIDQPCDITCDQNSACESSIINATYSSSFNLRECRQGTNVCVGMTIYFPPYDNINGKPRANITGDNSLSAGDPPRPLQFYAINGWKDVDVINYIGDYTYQEGTMYCGIDYSNQCAFANDSFECVNPTDMCSGSTATPNPTRTLTTNPSKSPTLITLYPSKTPTVNPSTSPTYMPSESPTTMPSGAPTMPTNRCRPDVSLHGISIYSSTNLNLNGIIDIFAQIIFSNKCRFKYKIIWNVVVEKLYTDDPTDIENDKLSNLQTYLGDSMDIETLSIDADLYLQSGMNYIFSVIVEGRGITVESTHELMFDYDAIQCQIATNDIFLDNVDPEIDLNDLVIEINGLLLTYDPNKYDTANNHLSWQWDCMDVDDVSCDYILNSNTNSVVYADFKGFDFRYSTFYSFVFAMHVIDNDNLYRPECIDSVKMEFNTKSSTTNGISEKLFIVSLTAIKTEININDRLRLIGNIMNYDDLELIDEGIMEYQWSELNGLLSNEDIQKYKETSDNSSNLILKENVLTIGEIYSFQLTISQYTDSSKQHKIGYGISTSITISTLQKPQIINGSFQIQPNCNAKYKNINELLSISHTLSISADSQYEPLSYQFGYYSETTETKHYYDASILSDSSISNIYLSIGDFSIFGNVIDSKSSMITETIDCSIQLDSYSQCLDFYADLIEPYIESEEMISASDKYQLIFEKANIYIQYLSEYNGDDIECIERSLDGILSTLMDEIVDTKDALCFSVYPILLSQTMSLWMDLVALNKKTVYTFYKNTKTEKWMQIKTLLFATSDSCLYVTDNVLSVDKLTVSQDSIVTKIPKIYYQDADITHYLSPIITNPQYHDVLYTLASSMINMFEYLSAEDSIDLYNLLSASLYISELIRISLSIPGENRFTEFNGVSIYSVRVNNENVNVSVSNIFVFIPRDITNNDDHKMAQLFDSVDVLVVGINSSSTNNVSTIISEPDPNCNTVEGELSENSISITIVGNNTDTDHLSSSIDFVFECDENMGCDETFECVWYNEEDNLWQNDGCVTVIDYENKQIRCQCFHLTLFATIHNIHSSECENAYLKEWLLSTEWDYMNLIIGIVFLLLCMHSLYKILPFFRVFRHLSWRTHRAVLAVLLIGITAFLYVLVCIQAYVTKSNFNVTNIKIYSFLLLLPQITLFVLFSLIFYTWFTLAHGFLSSLHEIKQRLRKILVIVNICICVVLLLYYFISFSGTEYLFKIGAYLWAAILSICTIAITTYAFIVGKQLYHASKISQHQSFAEDDWKTVRRLLITNSFITFYFIFQCITVIYLSIDSEYQSVAYSLIYAFIDGLCLLSIYWMYRTSLHHLIEKIDHERHIAANLRTRRGITATTDNTRTNANHTIDFNRHITSTLPPQHQGTTLSRIASESVYSVTGNNTPSKIDSYDTQETPRLRSPVNTIESVNISPISPPSSQYQTQFKYKVDKISEEHEMSTVQSVRKLVTKHSITEYELEKVIQLKTRSFDNIQCLK